MIDIELKKHSRIKEYSHKLHSRVEDAMFAIIQKIPDKCIPRWLMNWMEKYLDKRIRELKQDSIKMTWQSMYLLILRTLKYVKCYKHTT